jgi:hypothetical protein
MSPMPSGDPKSVAFTVKKQGMPSLVQVETLCPTR